MENMRLFMPKVDWVLGNRVRDRDQSSKVLGPGTGGMNGGLLGDWTIGTGVGAVFRVGIVGFKYAYW